MKVGRRDFLQSASAGFGFALLNRTSPQNDLEATFKALRANVLDMINEERAVAKVPPVAIDELATQVATKHAVEMAADEFASHWGRDGLKPYHRYAFAGGTHATQENVSAADNTWSSKPADLKQDTAYLHVRLYQEKPPNDGHRRTILAPQHTHVGLGLALQDLRLRLVELFVAKYVEVTPLPRKAKPGAHFRFAGKIVNRDYMLNNVEVFYEPLPTPPELSWLREARSYALPNESRVLRPKAPPPFKYLDGTTGIIEVGTDGSFSTPISLFKSQPGIYTIVTWIRSPRAEKAFPATEVCVEAS